MSLFRPRLHLSVIQYFHCRPPPTVLVRRRNGILTWCFFSPRPEPAQYAYLDCKKSTFLPYFPTTHYPVCSHGRYINEIRALTRPADLIPLSRSDRTTWRCLMDYSTPKPVGFSVYDVFATWDNVTSLSPPSFYKIRRADCKLPFVIEDNDNGKKPRGIPGSVRKRPT